MTPVKNTNPQMHAMIAIASHAPPSVKWTTANSAMQNATASSWANQFSTTREGTP